MATKQEPPTVSDCFDGMSYSELGQLLLNTKEIYPEALGYGSDKLGRIICCAAWTSRTSRPQQPAPLGNGEDIRAAFISLPEDFQAALMTMAKAWESSTCDRTRGGFSDMSMRLLAFMVAAAIAPLVNKSEEQANV